jgi:uncharacterized membrane protein HdeD (DUF308 family)
MLAGAALLWNPLQGLITLTFILTSFFILDGIFVIILAIAIVVSFPGNGNGCSSMAFSI